MGGAAVPDLEDAFDVSCLCSSSRLTLIRFQADDELPPDDDPKDEEEDEGIGKDKLIKEAKPGAKGKAKAKGKGKEKG
jgi:hypothetical protein